MRIAYVFGENLELHPGLKNKVMGQVKVWEEQGNEVVLICHALGEASDPSGRSILRDEVLSLRDYSRLQAKNRLIRLALLRRQYRFLKRSLEFVKPDVTYGRYAFPFFGVKNGYSAAGPYVLEINSDDRTEFYVKHWTTGAYNSIFRRSLIGAAAGLVYVTEELSKSKSFCWYKGATAVIGNGANISAFPFIGKTDNSEPNLCFIASPGQRWNGLGKLGVIAQALPQCRVHIIGPGIEEYRRESTNVHPNMIFHGYLEDNEAKTIVARMDVGIATLSLYRKQMEEACPLKARQYLAQGVPVIGGYKDTDIENQPFFLQLPNLPNNVASSLDSIRGYVQAAFNNQKLRQQTREFAMRELDVERKEKVRLAYLKQVSDRE